MTLGVEWTQRRRQRVLFKESRCVSRCVLPLRSVCLSDNVLVKFEQSRLSMVVHHHDTENCHDDNGWSVQSGRDGRVSTLTHSLTQHSVSNEHTGDAEREDGTAEQRKRKEMAAEAGGTHKTHIVSSQSSSPPVSQRCPSHACLFPSPLPVLSLPLSLLCQPVPSQSRSLLFAVRSPRTPQGTEQASTQSSQHAEHTERVHRQHTHGESWPQCCSPSSFSVACNQNNWSPVSATGVRSFFSNC
jgi:hypothetical protein